MEGADAVIEKRELLEILGEALDALLPEERELAVRVVGEEMPVAEFARMKKENRRTLASRRDRVLWSRGSTALWPMRNRAAGREPI